MYAELHVNKNYVGKTTSQKIDWPDWQINFNEKINLHLNERPHDI